MDQERATFGAKELAICLSHYDLGVIHSIEDFPRGSRRAPKIVLDAEQGKFLFKRRGRGKEDLPRVAFTHQLQLLLAAQNFPLPHLIGTRKANNSMLVLEGSIYEMFEFISGGGYDGSLAATYHVGQTLALYHKLLQDFQSEYNPPTGSYHNAPAIHQAIRNSVGSLPLETRPPKEELTATVHHIEGQYRRCAEQADALGLSDWPRQVVHGDWHPGNMLFRDRRVVG